MKRPHAHFTSCPHRNWLIPLLAVTVFSLIFLLVRNPGQKSTSSTPNSKSGAVGAPPELPRLAYYLFGTQGDGPRLKRLLQAVYHPRNSYLLHLDLEASGDERLELAKYVSSEAVFLQFRNVMVVGKANLVTYKGPTTVASVLHAVAILLKRSKWDWFINLSASDYPLMPQDDLLHIFSYLPRDLNFIEHTSSIGWKEFQRGRPIIIDPGLYHSKKSGVFWAKEKRSIPSAFKLFMGSEWLILSRPFLEFSIWGWDNLPRLLLMYYTNFHSSDESYFHTLICNHKDYQNTTVNNNLHFMRWDTPPKQHPHNLTLEHFSDMVQSGAPFAREFAKDNPVLNKIDKQLLKRPNGRFTPGGWCLGTSDCAVYGIPDAVKPSASSKRLEKLVLELLDRENFRTSQCKV